MKAAFLVVICFFVAFPSLSSGTVNGTFTINGKKENFNYAYANWNQQEDKKESQLTLWLSELPLPENPDNREFLASSQINGNAIKFVYSRKCDCISSSSQYFKMFENTSMSSAGMHNVKFEALTDNKAQGRIWSASPTEAMNGATYTYDATFSIDLDKASSLPSGGGDPGKAYLAFVNAIHAGKIESIRPFIRKEYQSQFDKSGNEMLPIQQKLTPTEIKILGGSIKGEAAVLKTEGKLEGKPVKIEVIMEREDGKWKQMGQSIRH